MTNGDRLGPFLTGVALHRVCTVTGRIDADIRTDETVIANGDTGFIEDGEVEISKESPAYAYLLAIVAVKRLVDEKVIICNRKELLLSPSVPLSVPGQWQNKPHPPTSSLSLSYA